MVAGPVFYTDSKVPQSIDHQGTSISGSSSKQHSSSFNYQEQQMKMLLNYSMYFFFPRLYILLQNPGLPPTLREPSHKTSQKPSNNFTVLFCKQVCIHTSTLRIGSLRLDNKTRHYDLQEQHFYSICDLIIYFPFFVLFFHFVWEVRSRLEIISSPLSQWNFKSVFFLMHQET